MTFRESAGNVVTALAVLSAVTVAGITVRREFFPGAPRTATGQSLAPTVVKNWQQYALGGHRLGPADATVTIVEFADFECPFCAKFANGSLRALRAKYPDQVAVIFRHWPLPYHRFAMPAARAAECAAAQGQFEAFHDALYREQDSLGLKTFGEFAKESGVTDTLQFDQCYRRPGAVAVIDRDTAAVRALGGRGTPTVIVDGLLYPSAPDSAALDKIVGTAVAKARVKG